MKRGIVGGDGTRGIKGTRSGLKRELHHESCTPNVLHGCPLLRLIRSAEGAGRECGKDAMRKGWERNGEVKGRQ